MPIGHLGITVPDLTAAHPPPYVATFWLDPFGFLLEAVCHHDQD